MAEREVDGSHPGYRDHEARGIRFGIDFVKRLSILIVAFSILGYGVSGYCQELSISSKVDKERLTQDEYLTLTITISGKMRSAPDIELPDLKEFEVLSKSSSRNISIKGKKAYILKASVSS